MLKPAVSILNQTFILLTIRNLNHIVELSSYLRTVVNLTPGSILGIAAAKGWPAHIIADSLRHVHPSDVPTLLISGSIDFSTPARFAKDDLLPFLKNGHQVILSEFGHTGDIWGKQREALNHMLNSFYNTGVVDDSRFTYSPISFKVGLGYPTIMKLVVAGAIFIIMIISGIIWLVVRKIRH